MNYQIYLNQKKIWKPDECIMNEFAKRLSAYCKVRHFMVPGVSPDKIIAGHSASSHIRYLQVCPGITTPASEEFAAYMNELRVKGISQVCFFVGYNADTEKTADMDTLSLTSFSLSVGMTGILLYEQLYRSYRILNHQPYHK